MSRRKVSEETREKMRAAARKRAKKAAKTRRSKAASRSAAARKAARTRAGRNGAGSKAAVTAKTITLAPTESVLLLRTAKNEEVVLTFQHGYEPKALARLIRTSLKKNAGAYGN